MSEDLNRDEEVQETTPSQESESADSEDIFGESQEEDKTESKDNPEIDSLKKELRYAVSEIKNLKKGAAKFFSDEGRQEYLSSMAKKDEVKEKEPAVNSAVIKNLFMKSNPEAELVWQDVEKEAKLLNKDPFELYEASSFFKGEAKARMEAKEQEEKDKSKIAKPSSQSGESKINFSKLSQDQITKLSSRQKAEYFDYMVAKERNIIR